MRTVAFSILLSSLLIITTGAHPVHVSVTNMDVRHDSGWVDYSIRLFYDDFQALINHNYDTELDFGNGNRMTTKEQDAILDYLWQHFALSTDEDRLLDAEFRGWMKEEQTVSFLFRADIHPAMKGLRIYNTLMLDLFPDQTNLVIMQGKQIQNGWEFTKRNTIQNVIFR